MIKMKHLYCCFFLVGVFQVSCSLGERCSVCPTNEEMVSPEGEIEAIEICREVLSEFSGESLPSFEGTTIWLEGRYMEWEGKEVLGLLGVYYPSWELIFIIWRGNISDSSLAHELVHYWLKAVTKDPDSLHESFWWEAVPLMNGALREAGL